MAIPDLYGINQAAARLGITQSKVTRLMLKHKIGFQVKGSGPRYWCLTDKDIDLLRTIIDNDTADRWARIGQKQYHRDNA